MWPHKWPLICAKERKQFKAPQFSKKIKSELASGDGGSALQIVHAGVPDRLILKKKSCGCKIEKDRELEQIFAGSITRRAYFQACGVGSTAEICQLLIAFSFIIIDRIFHVWNITAGAAAGRPISGSQDQTKLRQIASHRQLFPISARLILLSI